MYEPFEQAIDRFQPHPEHKVSLEIYEDRLAHCDACHARDEMSCKAHPTCKTCTLIRRAEMPALFCPWGRWEE